MLNENDLGKKFQKAVFSLFLYDPGNESKIHAFFHIPPVHADAIQRDILRHTEDGDGKPPRKIIEEDLIPDLQIPFFGISDSKFTAEDARTMIKRNLLHEPPTP